MRIAIVAPNQRVVGGAESYLRWLIPDLVAGGHVVGVGFERSASSQERALDLGVDPLVRWDIGSLGAERFLSSVAAFAPDVVYLHSVEDAALDVALSRRFPSLLFAHAYYASCATGTRSHRLPVPAICERRFGAACLPLNYALGCGARRPDRLLASYLLQRRRLGVLSAARAIVVASRHVRDVYVRQGVPPERIHVIPYPAVGVERDPAPPLPREQTGRVLFLGRLTRLKGLAHAIRAVAAAAERMQKRLVLEVAGEGPDGERARETAVRLGADVRFLGFVDAADRVSALRRADVLILPSLWPEPFGMVGVEAGCVGLPSVAYAVGGIPDWLRSGVSGELAGGTAFDEGALASALVRALGDASHHQRLREGAWTVAGEYSTESHRNALSELLTSVANKREAS